MTLSLLETLVSLDSEEVMVELVLKHLFPCSHVMLSQRRRLREVDPYSPSALRFLSLSPSCCSVRSSPLPVQPQSLQSAQTPAYGLRPEESLYGNYHAYLCDAKSRIETCAKNCSRWSQTYNGDETKLYNILNISSNKSSAINKNENCDKTGDSLQSLGDSSGYNSFAMKGSPETTPENEPEDEKKEEVHKSFTSNDKVPRSMASLEPFNSTPDIG